MKKLSILVFAVVSTASSFGAFAYCTDISIGQVCCKPHADGGYECELR